MPPKDDPSHGTGPGTGQPRPPRFGLFAFLALIGLALIAGDLFNFRQGADTVPYSRFLALVDEGRVSEVLMSSDRISGVLKEPTSGKPKEFVTTRVEDPELVKRLQAQNVKFSGAREGGILLGMISWLLPFFLLMMLWSWVMRRAGGLPQGGGFLSLGKSKAKIYVETNLKTRFDDVAGVDEAKEELREIVNYLKSPDRYSKLGGKMPKGILLVGPPGTGKTLLARAVAGESGVPFFSINGSEFVELFVGLGAARVRDLFEQARAKAPCIVFIDELDAIGKARGIAAITGSTNDEKEQTLNQLLAEMDGFDTSQGLMVLAATNRPEVLDPALLRAGRFDRQIMVDKPDRLGREKILAIHMKRLTLSSDVDITIMAGMTAGFSGADLANLANEAALIATRRGADKVELRDFTAAIERIIAGLERRSRVLGTEEKRRVAFHEMGHAAAALALGEKEVVHKVSIIPRGVGALGYTMRRPTEDRYLMSRGELESKIAIALGGRAAETVFFDDISTGAGDDLDQATDIARAMVTRYGMAQQLGLAVYERDPTPILGSQTTVRSFEYSEETAQRIDREIQAILERGMERAVSIVKGNRPLIEEAVATLLAIETLDEAALKGLWSKYHPEGEPRLAVVGH
jgi:cell division protease FtsH